MIALDQASIRFGDRVALHPLTLTLTERRVGVIGANGSGKSSFARLLNGLILPAEGTVTVDGLDTRSEGKLVRRRVGFLFQDPDAQIIMPIVGEDIAFGLKGRGLSKADIAAKVEESLERHGLANLRERPAHQLSGGEKQLLAIASVMVLEPEILVMDEPTTLLDLRNRRRLAERVAGLSQQVIAVTHDFEFLEGYDRVLVFDQGRLIQDAPPAAAIEAYRRALS